MPNTIKTGTILISEGALLPESSGIESEPYGYGWQLVKNLDSNGLDQIIARAGWNFFYMAEAMETSAFGSDEKMTTRKAIKQIISKLKVEKVQLPGDRGSHGQTILGATLHIHLCALAPYPGNLALAANLTTA